MQNVHDNILHKPKVKVKVEDVIEDYFSFLNTQENNFDWVYGKKIILMKWGRSHGHCPIFWKAD